MQAGPPAANEFIEIEIELEGHVQKRDLSRLRQRQRRRRRELVDPFGPRRSMAGPFAIRGRRLHACSDRGPVSGR